MALCSKVTKWFLVFALISIIHTIVRDELRWIAPLDFQTQNKIFEMGQKHRKYFKEDLGLLLFFHVSQTSPLFFLVKSKRKSGFTR